MKKYIITFLLTVSFIQQVYADIDTQAIIQNPINKEITNKTVKEKSPINVEIKMPEKSNQKTMAEEIQRAIMKDKASSDNKNSSENNNQPVITIESNPNNKTQIKTTMPKFELNEKVLNYSLTSSQIPPESVVYSESQRYINAIDPKPAEGATSYFPGLRGPNQLIIYTPSYGFSTGTNEFGTEAIVENNMVVRMNGADSIIPPNGFVISGHGNAKNWITKNLQVGSKVYIDFLFNQLKVYLTPESLIYSAKTKISDVDELINYYKGNSQFYDDKKAGKYLDDSKNLLKKAEKKPEKAKEYIDEALISLDEALTNAIPYYKNELKGIWLRPVEKTPEDIKKTVARLHDSGITDIFLETYFHGKTIYPSKFLQELGINYQREEFRGFDPLEVWIKEAHENNMKVHIWFESFYVGNDKPDSNYYHVLNVHPEWANKKFTDYNSDLPVPCKSEHNGFFLDPANYMVQSYLLDLIQEIVDTYHPDGINLDYIRYPQSVEPTYSNYLQSNWGYTPTARSEFQLIYDIDPIDIKTGTAEWELWSNYRQDKITEFIKRVKNITTKSNVQLTAVIFPDIKKSKATKMQNWQVWSNNNYIDGLTPLILTGDRNTAVSLLRNVFSNVEKSTKVYPGLFVTFMGGPFEDLLLQIHKTREFHANGAIMFDYAHFSDKYANALKTRVYNKSYDDKERTKGKGREFKISTKKDYKPEVKFKDKKNK